MNQSGDHNFKWKLKRSLLKELVVHSQFEGEILPTKFKIEAFYFTDQRKYVYWKIITDGWHKIDPQKGDLHPLMHIGQSNLEGIVHNTRGIRRLFYFMSFPDRLLFRWSDGNHPCIFRSELIQYLHQFSSIYKIDF